MLLNRSFYVAVPALLCAVVLGTARAETFDLTTFSPPPGARSETAESVSFTDATPSTFAVYGVYRSARGTGDAARDFREEWDLLVAPGRRRIGELKTEVRDWPGGWKLTLGAAKVWSEESREFTSVLAVFTGHGVKSSVVVHYNDDRYRPQIDRFLSSVRLARPAVAVESAPPAPAVDDGAASVSLTSNEWYRSIASTWASDGYVRYRYRFAPDGSYTFVKEWWSQYHHADYWFIEESGRYRVDGATIQITPTKALKILRDKAGRAKGKAEPVALEPATYRFRFQQLLKPTLILTPTSGQHTDRDGKQFSFAGDGKSYYYEPPARCEQRPAPPDCP
ncbi:MAG: hypothetical protein N2688_11710 [Burkholderiaceae bacterium]|nr:hypothetical protein [Burkholderiaceae bacterium]